MCDINTYTLIVPYKIFVIEKNAGASYYSLKTVVRRQEWEEEESTTQVPLLIYDVAMLCQNH